MYLNPLAEALNADLSTNGATVLQMLSAAGKAIFFPSKGILGQSAEAKGSAINATIGTTVRPGKIRFASRTQAWPVNHSLTLLSPPLSLMPFPVQAICS